MDIHLNFTRASVYLLTFRNSETFLHLICLENYDMKFLAVALVASLNILYFVEKMAISRWNQTYTSDIKFWNYA